MKAETMKLSWPHPGCAVRVKRIRFGGLTMSGHLQESVETWDRATFVGYCKTGEPIVQWPDGSKEVLRNKADMQI